MRRFLIFFLTVLAFAGCILSPDSFEEGLPKFRDKLKPGTKVYLSRPLQLNGTVLFERSERIITRAFREALEAQGAVVEAPDQIEDAQEKILARARKDQQDVILFITVKHWEYGDAGFSGFGGRDDITLAVLWMKVKTGRVLSRATIRIVNAIGSSPTGGASTHETVRPVLRDYLDTVFEPKE